MGVRVLFLLLCLVALDRDTDASQQRSKLSRVKADMRSVATAIAAYRVDHPDQWPTCIAGTGQLDPEFLTTPVAYLSDHRTCQDLFKNSLPAWYRLTARTCLWIALGCMVGATVASRLVRKRLSPVGARKLGWPLDGLVGVTFGVVFVSIFPPPARSDMEARTPWLNGAKTFHFTVADDGFGVLQSLGPDGDIDAGVQLIRSRSMPANGDLYGFLPEWHYDPTNGTDSGGDIIRLVQ